MGPAAPLGFGAVTSAATDHRFHPESEAEVALWLTGTGTPIPHPERAGPSNYLRVGDQHILIDVGNGVAGRLAGLEVDLAQLTHVFITHHHVDHNADLAYVMLSPWLRRRETPYRPPVIFGPPGTREVVDRLLAAQELDMRYRVPHGFDPGQLTPPVVELEDGDRVGGAGWSCVPFRVEHDPVEHAFGFRFEIDDVVLVFSGDTRPCSAVTEHAMGADVLVHEALLPGFGIPEYHSSAADVGRIARTAGVSHLVLTHLIPGHLDDELWLREVTPEFQGRVTVGADLLRIF